MVQPTPIDRARGCLLGLAVGDALGAPLEGLTPQQIRAHYHQVTDYVDGSRAWKKKPHRWRLPGLYTDDTQQALALADVLLKHHAVEPEALAAQYLALATPKGTNLGAHRSVGKSFRQVMKCLENGGSPRYSGQTSAGIGAAMRIAPVALYYAGDPDAMFEAVMSASLMTHRDIRSLAGAMAVAHAVQRLLGQKPKGSFPLWLAADVSRAVKKMAAIYHDQILGVENFGGSLSEALARVEDLLGQPREQALGSIVEEANRHGANPVCRRPTMGFAPACIPTCLYLLLTSDSFEEAMIDVINLGGDTDTAGAILGALAGTLYGVQAIPERWLNGLQNRDGIDLRAQALFHRSAAGFDIPDFLATERYLSQEEAECRENLLSCHGGDLGANRLF
jgi:ADP-ribosyl-[dinitrogen reductase] hydrolase